MAKKKKLLVKVLIIIVSVIAVIAVGAYCVFNFYIKPKYADKVMEAINVMLEDEELMSDIAEVIEDEQVQAEIENVLAEEGMSEEIGAVLESVDLSGITTENPPSEQKGDTQKPSNQDSKPQTSPQPQKPDPNTAQSPSNANPTEQPKKEQSLMEKAKENVDPKDFADGMKLATKIDVGYILGLMSGGLTEEEKAEAKAYFKTKYTKAERNRIKGYMAKYAHLLE